MKRFQLIEHTADTGLIAYGSNLAEAFANAAYGLFSIITALNRVRAVTSRPVSINAEDAEGLLFDWLNHLIYLFEVERLLFKRFDIREFTHQNLQAICWGEQYDPARHQLKLGVKSATYHMLKVDEERNRVQVIFDV
ncbi:archease [Chloroflexota bacterium]